MITDKLVARCELFRTMAIEADKAHKRGNPVEAAKRYACARDGFQAVAGDVVGLLAALDEAGYRPAQHKALVSVARNAGRAAEKMENLLQLIEADQAR